MKIPGFSAALVCGSLVAAGEAVAAPCHDLALVLAIDASGSVDAFEYRLQTQGIAAAFRSEPVKAALAGAGSVAASAVFWSDPARDPVVVGWHDLDGPGGPDRFADRILAVPRGFGGQTGLGAGLWAALDVLADPALCAARKVVNVSGDGVQGRGSLIEGRGFKQIEVRLARARAERLGVTVNALAITRDEPGLAAYYRSELLAGPGAFVMEVDDYHDFAEAILLKLRREIEPMIAGRGTHAELAMAGRR